MIGGKRVDLTLQITTSSVNYFILSFLPPLQIIRLQQLNKRYYNLYVPVTLSTVTVGGTVPSEASRPHTFALQIQYNRNLLLL